jgi:hypothetical protein
MDDFMESQHIMRFALEESVREIGAQSAAQDRLKSRALSVLGLTFTITSFMVGIALQSAQRGWRFYVPMAVGTVLVAALGGLWWQAQKPIQDWLRRLDPTILIQDFTKGEPYTNWLDLAQRYQDALQSNQEKLAILNEKIQRMIGVAIVAAINWIVMLWLVAS